MKPHLMFYTSPTEVWCTCRWYASHPRSKVLKQKLARHHSKTDHHLPLKELND